MTDRRYRVIDCDAHYLESFEEIARYMEEPWRTRLEDSDFDDAGHKHNSVSFFPTSTGDRAMWGALEREHTNYGTAAEDPENVPLAMEYLGIDATVLISHTLLTTAGISAADDRENAFAKAYTEYMLDRVVDPDEGIYALLPLPYDDVPFSLSMLDEYGREAGIVGACLIAAGASPPLGNRKYDPLYERGVELGLPFVFHTGGSGLDSYVRSGYGTFLETHVLGFLESNTSQLVSLVVQGTLEKYPALEVVFMESGVTYIPALMARLDEEYLKRTEEAPLLKRRPSEYLREIHYGTQPLERNADERFLKLCIEMVGVDQLLYASDYPHWDYDPVNSVTELPFLGPDAKQRILADNAAAVFGI